jgi:hypothetical protein
MKRKALNVIMGLIMAGSAAIAFKSSEAGEIAGWTVAALCCAIFLADKFEPKGE